MIKLGYCAGHGGSNSTPGKRTPDNEYEWGFNDKVAKAFANELAKYNGIELKRFDDSTGKTDIPLKTRTDNANKWGAHYYISFHHNANTAKWGNWTGVETFTYTNASVESRKLAMAVHPALVEAYGLKDRGIKAADLHIVRETKCPSILVEGGFMDSTIDIKVLRNSEKLQNAGVLMAQAVASHLNLKKKVGASTVTQQNQSSIGETTFRKEAIAEIKAAVSDGRFTSKHENVENYSTEELQYYTSIALIRRK